MAKRENGEEIESKLMNHPFGSQSSHRERRALRGGGNRPLGKAFRKEVCCQQFLI